MTSGFLSAFLTVTYTLPDVSYISSLKHRDVSEMPSNFSLQTLRSTFLVSLRLVLSNKVGRVMPFLFCPLRPDPPVGDGSKETSIALRVLLGACRPEAVALPKHVPCDTAQPHVLIPCLLSFIFPLPS